MSAFDVVIIGSGPGGYVAAIRCAQLGMKTAIIEKYSTLGGTCLNVGCIPSKAMLASSHHYEELQHFADHGIEVTGDVKVNLQKMIDRKQAVVDQTSGGVKYLMDKNNVTVYQGIGSFENATTVNVTKADGSVEKLEAKNVIIGGGVICLELGQVYLRLGAQVSVVEFMDRIIPGMDAGLSKELTKVLKKQGMKFYTSHKVQAVDRVGEGVVVKAENAKGEVITLEGDYALVSVGRRPYTDGLNAEKAGVKLTERGQVEVNDHLQTTASNIYAIGDVVRGAMLAHKAEEEGVMVAEYLAGQKPHIDYNLIPGVVYTWPEVAAVGKTEEQLKEAGVAYKAGSFPFKALGRARASADNDGFVKILADAKTDEVLGIHMIGARAADLIAEAVTAMEFRASAEDISRMSHAHPTFAEAIKEAALAATDNRALHV